MIILMFTVSFLPCIGKCLSTYHISELSVFHLTSSNLFISNCYSSVFSYSFDFHPRCSLSRSYAISFAFFAIELWTGESKKWMLVSFFRSHSSDTSRKDVPLDVYGFESCSFRPYSSCKWKIPHIGFFPQ